MTTFGMTRNVRRITSKLIEKRYLSEDIILIRFELSENDAKNFEFKAGQFFKILFDPLDENSFRSYSILNPPSKKGHIESCIKLVSGGYGSEKLRIASVGQVFIIDGPYGVMKIDPEKVDKNNAGGMYKDFVLICNGTGITPFYSIIHEHMPKMSQSKFTLIYGTTKRDELVFHEEFEQLEKKYKNFQYIPTLTREDWAGRTGRVQEHFHELQDLKNKNFYICGLKEMIKDAKDKLQSEGVSMANIHIERYD